MINGGLSICDFRFPIYASSYQSRDSSISWIDGNGDLWLFGGAGHDSTSYGLLSDLWKFECVPPVGDLNGDCIVNFIDFAIFASHWLEKGLRN